MAVINFLDYTVSEMNYHRNENFEESVDGKIGYQPVFNYNVSNMIDDEFGVKLSVELNSDNFPYYFKLEIIGKFKFDKTCIDSDMSSDYKDYRVNALAIMFPYVRNVVSQLTLMSNEFPSLQFPTIDVNKFVQEQSTSD